MPKKQLTAKQKLAALRQVREGQSTVADICRQLEISRMTFYRWVKKYDAAPNIEEKRRALESKAKTTAEHWRRLSSRREKEILDQVAKKPQYSVHKLADKIDHIGHHGVQNVLDRYRLSTYQDRVNFSNQFGSKKENAHQRKIQAIKDYLAQDKTISRICLENNISRMTFYRWLERFRQSGESFKALKSQRPRGEEHWRFVDERLENKILKIAGSHPEYSAHKIASLLEEVGNHGVQNVLKRNLLNTYELRLTYAQHQRTKEAVTSTMPDLVSGLPDLFGSLPGISSIPPPVFAQFKRVVKPFLLTLITTL
ncbi:helix-turn-helix domain-containing protein, partial [Patescibacteria group bacterium]|nr:helix-turn-helix domain-containing protein [Patescibacteria group bacterium]